MTHPFGGKIDYDFVRSLYSQNGYKFQESKYGINLLGIRNKDLVTVDKFNDLIGAAYVDAFGNRIAITLEGTTKPGLTYLKDRLVNPNGTAILIPGFYEEVFSIGTHNFGRPTAHEAFIQATKFKVWRDNDLDGHFDFAGRVYDDVTGLNLHRAGVNETFNVGPYSAACQVARDDKEHGILMAVGKRCFELYQKRISYALFQEK